MKRIILASGSPRRKQLLQQLDLPFTVHPSSVDEHYDCSWMPATIVQTLAERKAKDVAQHYEQSLVIGADTLVVFEDTILEKPTNPSEAKSMLQQLGNKSHQVLTGVYLIKTGASNNIIGQTTFVEKTDVVFGTLKNELIDAYIATGSPLDKAGGYGIQDRFGALFVEKIDGDYYNVVGFPLHRFYNTVDSFAPEFLSRNNLYEQTNEK
ncbi:MAG: Maf family protein [Bacteroidota bacterium]